MGITGTTIAFPFMMVVMAFSMLVGFGAAALISIRLGEGKRDEAERVLGNSVVLLVLVSVLITAVAWILLDPDVEIAGGRSSEPAVGARLPADHCARLDVPGDRLWAQRRHSW